MILNRCFLILVVMLFLFSGSFLNGPLFARAAGQEGPQPAPVVNPSEPEGELPQTPEQPTIPDATAFGPLPGGCPGSTGPNDPAVCCISGLVYVDGKPVAGAVVEIQTEQGKRGEYLTFNHSDNPQDRAYYAVKLSTELSVAVGETITLTARYTDTATTQVLTKKIIYQTKPGGQQVDFALISAATSGYALDKTIWYAAEPGQLDDAHDVALDADDNVYIADSGNHRIQVFDPQGKLLRYWGTPGRGNGQFNNPTSLTIGPDGRLYVLDKDNYRIQIFTLDGIFVEAWGSQGSGVGQFGNPLAIEVDADNRVYVAESYSDRIHRFSSSGEWQRSWGESGTGNGQFTGLTMIALARESGRLFSVEYYRIGTSSTFTGRIQVFDLDGNWIATWTDRVGGGGGNWLVANIATDTQGNLYAADDTGVHRLSTDGTTTQSWSIGNAKYHNFAVASTGTFYVTYYYGEVSVFRSNGQPLPSIGGVQTPNGHFFRGGAEALAVSDNNILAVVQRNNSNVGSLHLFDLRSGDWITTSASSRSLSSIENIAIWNDKIYVLAGGQIVQFGVDGERRASYDVHSFVPERMVVDSNGRIIIPDRTNALSLQIINPNGDGPLNSTVTLQSDTSPISSYGLAIDPQDRLYMTNLWCDCIGRFALDGSAINDFGTFIADVYSYPDWLNDVQVDNAGFIYAKEDVHPTYDFSKYDINGRRLRGLPIEGYVAKDGSIYQIDPWNRILFYQPTGQPIATINHISSISGEIGAGSVLTLTAMGQDSDASDIIRNYKWTSNRDGLLGEGVILTLTANLLQPGAHTISLVVEDDEGEWSAPVTWPLEVLNDGPLPEAAWGMLLYLAGDQSDRYDDARLLARFNSSIERVRDSFTNSQLRIAVQIDGPRRNDSRRLLITPGDGSTEASIIESEWTEYAMDSPGTLTDFILWAQEEIPAERYYLSIADHGQAVQGIAWDKTSDLAGDNDINGSALLTVQELAQALSNPQIRAIDILHLDACSMNLLETAWELKDAAKFLISSQYLAWDYFPYEEYAPFLTKAVSSDSAATNIMQTYADRVHIDDLPYTIAVLNLNRIDGVMSALDDLANHLIELYDEKEIAFPLFQQAITGAQSFDTNGDTLNTDADLYVDLIDWALRMADSANRPTVTTRVDRLLDELRGDEPFILSSERSTETIPSWHVLNGYINLFRASGLSIIYARMPQGYVFNAYKNGEIFSFTNSSRWDEFLGTMPGSLGGSPIDEMPGLVAPLPSQGVVPAIYLPLIQAKGAAHEITRHSATAAAPSPPDAELYRIFLPGVAH